MTVAETMVLFEYDQWATDRTMESVSTLPGATYFSDLKSSHGGIHGTLVHLYGASAVWLARWKGTSPPRLAGVSEVPDMASLRDAWKRYRADLGGWLADLTEEKLAAPLSYLDLKGNPQAQPLYQQVQHCLNHATYHRGQVVTMLRQAGGTPAGTDLIMFYRARPTRPLRETLEKQNY